MSKKNTDRRTPEEWEAIPGLRKRCRNCKGLFGLKNLTRQYTGRALYAHDNCCRACGRMLAAKQREMFPEKFREAVRKHHAKHPEYLEKNRKRRASLKAMGHPSYQ